MNRYVVAAMVSLGMLQCACAKSPQQETASGLTEEALVARNEQRINSLETQVSSLNMKIEQINNRMYEVRTKSGQKTSMTVVPVLPSSPLAGSSGPIQTHASNSAFEATQLGTPHPAAASAAAYAKSQGKVIIPGSRPSPLPKNQGSAARVKTHNPQTASKPAGAAGSMGKPDTTAGPTGQLGTQNNEDLSLPPADIPAIVAQSQQAAKPAAADNAAYRAPASQAAEQPVPVPALPDSGLSLPPESGAGKIPPVIAQNIPAQAAPAASGANVPNPANSNPANSIPANSAVLPKGEVNAYNAALKAVRSGHSNEGIQMFKEFLQQYPNGKYAANAEYWIGESLYQQGKYSDALSQFNTVNSSFPAHHKNADALLKAGMSLGKMGDSAAAHEKYRAILTQFPASDAAKKVRAMGIR